MKLLGLSFESLDDYEKPVAVKAEFTLPEAFAGETRTATLTDASLWSLLLGVTVNEERKAALDLGALFESRCNFTVALPAAFRFDKVPQTQVVNSAWGTYRLTVKPVKPTPRRLEFLSVLELSNLRVAPADFPAFEEFIESVQAAYRATVSLAVTTDPGDVPLLEEALALTPKDTVTASRSRKSASHRKSPTTR